MTITDQIVTQARARFEHAAARKLIQEKYQARMLFAAQGGMWRAGPELQTMLLTCPGVTAVILDLYDTPVQVNTQELFALSQQRWQEQMNAWLVEYEQLNQNR
jgi:hypothetical protein